MRLYDRLPDGVFVNGKHYRMDFDFRNVLRMIDILQDEYLMPEAREYNALKCVMKRPKNIHLVLLAVKGLLFSGKPPRDQRKITDFKQDAAMIRAAFRQAYGIDLYRDRLHWFEFSELLSNIPEGNRYSEVIGIRIRPMPKATKYNMEERAWLLKAKAEVGLEMTEEERQSNYDRDVTNIAAFLMGMAEKKEVKPDAEPGPK